MYELSKGAKQPSLLRGLLYRGGLLGHIGGESTRRDTVRMQSRQTFFEKLSRFREKYAREESYFGTFLLRARKDSTGQAMELPPEESP
jgi:hypothetical protein